jgi:uncharacterized YigZ family protein
MRNQIPHQDVYYVAAAKAEGEIKVKGSRFLASLLPVSTKEEAEDQYHLFRSKYDKATHHCFAYRINEHIFRYSDDGEPSGTAGKPILQSIDGFGVNGVLCIVTRWYGGTKLGTGGLIRAYSDAANEALQHLKIQKKIKTKLCRLIFSYDLEPLVRRYITEYKAAIKQMDYAADVRMNVAVAQSRYKAFLAEIPNRFNLSVKFGEIKIDEKLTT